MTQIKSEKAKERLEYYCSDMDITYPLSNEQVEELIQIAETEAEERHAIEAQQVRDKCFSDIKEFTAKWEASDRKMDALHLKEINRLKNYIKTIIFAIERADHLCEVKRFVELDKSL